MAYHYRASELRMLRAWRQTHRYDAYSSVNGAFTLVYCSTFDHLYITSLLSTVSFTSAIRFLIFNAMKLILIFNFCLRIAAFYTYHAVLLEGKTHACKCTQLLVYENIFCLARVIGSDRMRRLAIVHDRRTGRRLRAAMRHQIRARHPTAHAVRLPVSSLHMTPAMLPTANHF